MRRELLNSFWIALILGPLLTLQAINCASAANPPGEDVEALIQAGHWKRARTILEPRVKANPQDPKSSYLLAKVKGSFRDFDGALPLAQHAVDLNGANSDYHLVLGQIFGQMAARASIFSAGPLAVRFRKEVEIAIELDSKNLDALDSMMQFKFQAPGLMGGSKDEARALADRITALNTSEGYLAHAELADLEKQPAQIEVYLLKAVEADSTSYNAITTLAKFYTYNPHAKYAVAMKQAQHALQLDPTRIGAYWILTRVLALQEQWSDLDAAFARSEQNVSDDLRPLYEAAQALLETGKEIPRAEGYVKRYLSQEPEGEEPDLAEAHRLLGVLFEKEGRKPEARAEIQTALRMRPNFKAAKDDLRRMDSQ